MNSLFTRTNVLYSFLATAGTVGLAASVTFADPVTVTDSGNPTKNTTTASSVSSSARFEEVDRNNDGMVTWQELGRGFDNQLSEAGLTETRLLRDFDLDQDRLLNAVEFRAFTTSFTAREQHPANATELADENADGTVESIVNVTKVQQLPASDIVGKDVVDLDDEKIGEAQDVVRSRNGSQTGIVVTPDGIMAEEVVINVEEVSLDGDRVLWAVDSGSDAIDQLPEYNEKDYVSIR